MLTKDEQKNQNGQNAQKTGVQNTNLDDVLLGKRVKIARKEKRITQVSRPAKNENRVSR